MNTVYSMTGFAGLTRDTPLGTLSLELRSVNHRYLEVTWKGPEDLRSLEIPMREALQKGVGRGKVECRVSFKSRQTGATGQPNPIVLAQLSAWHSEVKKTLPDTPPMTLTEVLAWPGILERQDLDADQLTSETLRLMQDALKDLSDTRAREGTRLREDIIARAKDIDRIRLEVAPKILALVGEYKERLTEKLREALGHDEEERVSQEVIVYAARIDVEEEIARLGVHIAEVQRVLEAGGAVGKRLDFLMQELNREANTLGSKSVASQTSQAALDIKVLIEQMREQIQNLE